ncbi:MAG: T9SS type A sorting domain-containing protein, partial [Bacteroidia bacterium]|nr:T9SS type A sorting domain-containing protein [Bacteroidia bacterium]MDW8157921.1 T9SS type A sorting domain-containing protein [Bacteroidia bacterium]
RAIAIHNLSSTTAQLTWSAQNSNAQCFIITYGDIQTPEQLWNQILVPSTVQSYQVTGLETGRTYGVRIIANCTACSPRLGQRSAPSELVTFTTPGAKLSELNSESVFHVYPNPSNGYYWLSLGESSEGILQIQVLDLKGKVMYKETFSSTNSSLNDSYFLNLSALPSGVYILLLQNSNTAYSIKITKE